VGDEALLIERTTGVPVAVSPNRQAAAVVLMRDQGCNIVLSDDGLQRYLLGTPRTIEIIVIDALKRFGNGCLLPVGPLREPLSRLESADFVIQKIPYSDHLDDPDPMGFYLKPVGFVLIEPGIPRQYPLDYFKRYPVVHAYAGIGHPDSFFKTLRDLGLRVIEHPFADHHVYTQEALLLYPGCPIIMTQKDAMRMDPAWEIPNVYYLAVEVHCGSGWIELFQKKIQECFACLS
jgi:tetraacyldisaccharide 4'-kinase